MESLFLCAANNSMKLNHLNATLLLLHYSKKERLVASSYPAGTEGGGHHEPQSVILKAFCVRKRTRAAVLLRYLLVQNGINRCPGELQRGHAGVQLIFHISASRSSITQSIDPSVLCGRFHTVHTYWFCSNGATNNRTAEQHRRPDAGSFTPGSSLSIVKASFFQRWNPECL